MVPVACVRPSSFYGLSAYKSHLILKVYLLQDYASSIYGKAKTTLYVWLGKGAGNSAHHTKHSENSIWWTWYLAKSTIQGSIWKWHISVHFCRPTNFWIIYWVGVLIFKTISVGLQNRFKSLNWRKLKGYIFKCQPVTYVSQDIMKAPTEQCSFINMNFMDLYPPNGKMAKLDLSQKSFISFFYLYLFPKLRLLTQLFKFGYE